MERSRSANPNEQGPAAADAAGPAKTFESEREGPRVVEYMRNESGAARRGRVDHQTDRDESPNSGGGGVALTEDSIGKRAGRQAGSRRLGVFWRPL